MKPGAGKTGNRLVFAFGTIRIIVQLVLDVEAGRRASENETSHHQNMTAQTRLTVIYRKVWILPTPAGPPSQRQPGAGVDSAATKRPGHPGLGGGLPGLGQAYL